MISDLLNCKESGFRIAKSIWYDLLVTNIANYIEVLRCSWLQSVADSTVIPAAATRLAQGVSATAHFHQLPMLILAKIVAVS